MLQKFRVVNAEGLKGLTIGGDFIPFDKLTDEKAETLLGKTHVLERVGETPAAPALAELPPVEDDDKKKAQ